MGVRDCGVGDGAGVGGEAGAEGRRGFDIDDGTPVFGVNGGFGCECRIASFRLEVCRPVTGASGILLAAYISSSESIADDCR